MCLYRRAHHSSVVVRASNEVTYELAPGGTKDYAPLLGVIAFVAAIQGRLNITCELQPLLLHVPYLRREGSSRVENLGNYFHKGIVKGLLIICIARSCPFPGIAFSLNSPAYYDRYEDHGLDEGNQ